MLQLEKTTVFCGKICTALGKLLRKLKQVNLLALSSRTSILALYVVSLVCLEIFFIVRWLGRDHGVVGEPQMKYCTSLNQTNIFIY